MLLGQTDIQADREKYMNKSHTYRKTDTQLYIYIIFEVVLIIYTNNHDMIICNIT